MKKCQKEVFLGPCQTSLIELLYNKKLQWIFYGLLTQWKDGKSPLIF